jgi:hypothetical protein
MTWQSDGKAARARRIGLAWSAVLASLLVTACERGAEHDERAERNRAQLPYQLAISLAETTPPSEPARFEAVSTRPERIPDARLVAPRAVPSMPAPTMTQPLAFVLDIPPPAAPATSALVAPDEAPPASTTVLSAPEASLAIDAAPQLAAAAHPIEDRGVYIPQITESARAAYIAQVDAAAPGQRLAVRAGDQVLGSIQFQVADGVVSVDIGQVLDLFEGRFDSARFAALRGSQSAQSFVSLKRLQAAGIPLEYNAAYDELTLSARRG